MQVGLSDQIGNKALTSAPKVGEGELSSQFSDFLTPFSGDPVSVKAGVQQTAPKEKPLSKDAQLAESEAETSDEAGQALIAIAGPAAAPIEEAPTGLRETVQNSMGSEDELNIDQQADLARSNKSQRSDDDKLSLEDELTLASDQGEVVKDAGDLATSEFDVSGFPAAELSAEALAGEESLALGEKELPGRIAAKAEASDKAQASASAHQVASTANSGQSDLSQNNGQNGRQATADLLASLKADANVSLEAIGDDIFSLTEAVKPDALQGDVDFDTRPQLDLSQLQHKLDTTGVSNARQQAQAQLSGLASRVGEQIRERFTGKSSKFEIRLDPPELGKIDVRVEIGRDGKVMAVIAAQDASVADALTRNVKTLENALTQAGLNLSEKGIDIQLGQRGEQGSENPLASGSYRQNADQSRQTEELIMAEDAMSTPLPIQTWSRHRLDVTA